MLISLLSLGLAEEPIQEEVAPVPPTVSDIWSVPQPTPSVPNPEALLAYREKHLHIGSDDWNGALTEEGVPIAPQNFAIMISDYHVASNISKIKLLSTDAVIYGIMGAMGGTIVMAVSDNWDQRKIGLMFSLGGGILSAGGMYGFHTIQSYKYFYPNDRLQSEIDAYNSKLRNYLELTEQETAEIDMK